MEKDSQDNEQPTMPEKPQHHPKPAEQQQPEGPIETPGASPTPNLKNLIPPPE